MHTCLRKSALLILFVMLVLTVTGKEDKKKSEKKTVPEEYALLIGSCFNSQGFSVAGVSIEVSLKPAEGQKPSKQSWQAQTSPRGEFALRLPPGPATYQIRVKGPGWQPQEKEVEFVKDERMDVVFNLEPIKSTH
jgi:hypothetical protein